MDRIFSEILSMSVDSIWVIIAAIIVRAVVRKAPMYFRKVLWGLVGLRLLVPFSLESSLSLVPQKITQSNNIAANQVVAAPVEQQLSFYDVFSVIWLIVCFGFLIYGVVSYIKLKLKIMDGVLIKENIYHSDRIESPFVCGFIKPKIYLPYGLDEVTQNCVLQHEKKHIRNADHVIKAISFVALCIHWFNPLVWVSYYLLCKDIELSCDESVIKKYDEIQCKQYAKALLELGVNKVKFTACPVAFGEVSIKARIRSIINYKKAGKFLVSLTLVLCVCVAVCFMTEPEAMAKTEPEQEKVVIEKTTEVTSSASDTNTEEVSVQEKTDTEPDSSVVISEETEKTVNIVDETEAVTNITIVKPTESATDTNDNEESTGSEPASERDFANDGFVGQIGFLNDSSYLSKPPMHDKAVEAGVFADASERERLQDVLLNNAHPLDDVNTTS